MNEIDVFVSVGGVANQEQESFVAAIEQRLRSEGLIPHTVGRNTFGSDAPLTTISDLMKTCTGTVIIALERTYFASGLEKRGGPEEVALTEARYPTPWNQIEAAMAYCHGHPLLVIVEKGLRTGGFLDTGLGWYIQWLSPTPSSLITPQFNGVLASWRQKLIDRAHAEPNPNDPAVDLNEKTVIELVSMLRPSQLWSVLVALAVVIAGTFATAVKLFGSHAK